MHHEDGRAANLLKPQENTESILNDRHLEDGRAAARPRAVDKCCLPQSTAAVWLVPLRDVPGPIHDPRPLPAPAGVVVVAA